MKPKKTGVLIATPDTQNREYLNEEEKQKKIESNNLEIFQHITINPFFIGGGFVAVEFWKIDKEIAFVYVHNKSKEIVKLKMSLTGNTFLDKVPCPLNRSKVNLLAEMIKKY